MDKEPYILRRSGEGFNCVLANCTLRAMKCLDNASRLKIMKEFLNEQLEGGDQEHDWHQLALEIGQVLKVPWRDIVDVIDYGYIDYDSQENLKEYFCHCRISPKCIHFLQLQSGKAGKSNDKSRD